jgi:hypothetical protein
MSERILSPDKTMYLDGENWLPVEDDSQSAITLQDSIVAGDINITYHGSSQEPASEEIGGKSTVTEKGENSRSITQFQLLHTVELTSCENDYKFELKFSPLLHNDLVLVLQKMNLLAHRSKKLPSSIDIQIFDIETGDYLMELWKMLVKSRRQGQLKEMFELSAGLTIICVIGYLIIRYGL